MKFSFFTAICQMQIKAISVIFRSFGVYLKQKYAHEWQKTHFGEKTPGQKDFGVCGSVRE